MPREKYFFEILYSNLLHVWISLFSVPFNFLWIGNGKIFNINFHDLEISHEQKGQFIIYSEYQCFSFFSYYERINTIMAMVFGSLYWSILKFEMNTSNTLLLCDILMHWEMIFFNYVRTLEEISNKFCIIQLYIGLHFKL